MVCGAGGMALASEPAAHPVAGSGLLEAPRLMVQPRDADGIPVQESIYQPPEVSRGEQGFNEGALSLGIDARYMTDYIFRGIEVVEPGTSEDAINVQVDAHLQLDLGKLPDPFLRIFTNTAEGDDISNFQVFRAAVGAEWQTEAFKAAVGNQSFTYPDRTELDTSEVFLDLRLNDGLLFGEDDEILGPFVFFSYDYDTFEGVYVEAGFRRSFRVTDTALTLQFEGLVAYVDGLDNLFGRSPVDPVGSGFSHYQFGARAHYDLGTLLNISRRYGQWGVEGLIFYTDGIDNELNTDTQVWGGAGITFRY